MVFNSEVDANTSGMTQTGLEAAGDAMSAGLTTAANAAATAGPLGELTAGALSAVNTFLFGGSGPRDPDVQFSYAVEIDGISTTKFSEANGIEWTVATESFHEGGNNIHKINLIGQGSFKPMVLKKGFYALNTEFYRWLSDSLNPANPISRKTISIIVKSTSGDEVCRFNLYEAFCTKYKGPSFNAKQSEVAFEEVEITYNWFDFQPGDPLEDALNGLIDQAASAAGDLVSSLF